MLTTHHGKRVATTLLLGTALAVPTAGTALAHPADFGAGAAARAAAAQTTSSPALSVGQLHRLGLDTRHASLALHGDAADLTRGPAPVVPDDGNGPWVPIGLSVLGVLIAGGGAAELRRVRIRQRARVLA